MNSATPASSSALARDWSEFLRARDLAGGPGWLQALRSGAARAFESNGLPGKKDEAWKYTSLRRLEDLRPALGAAAADADADKWIPLLHGVDGYGFRMLGGGLRWLDQRPPEGVTVHTLADALSGRETDRLEWLRSMLEEVDFSGRGNAFEALNTALLGHGVVIHVGAGVDAGVCQAQWGSNGGVDPRLDNVRVIILLEADARLRLIEQFCAPGSPGPAAGSGSQPRDGNSLNLVVQARLDAGAEMDHIRLQKESSSDIVLTFNRIEQAERSRYRYAGFDVGGGLVRHAISCRLAGEDARADIAGAFIVDGERHVDHHICVDHLAPSSRSEQFFRGVLGGHGRGVFNGKAIIRPGADGSSVRQSNANLLLSELAEVDTKPELEIYADEVEASHGATVGQLDDQAVFYLRSRGLNERAARRMLTSAFCRTVTDRIADRQVAESIAALLDMSMPDADARREDGSH